LNAPRTRLGPIAARVGLSVQHAEAVTDIDFGEWSGSTFEALGGDPRWAAWNAARSANRPPGGESMLDVQCRAVSALERICGTHPDSGAVVVSHADVIKAMLAHYLGLALDAITRFEISPASVSTSPSAPGAPRSWPSTRQWPHEDRHLRPGDQFILGQRPCYLVARALPRAGRKGPPRGLLRA
jgi:broad specificity phosphatase PhoE